MILIAFHAFLPFSVLGTLATHQEQVLSSSEVAKA